MEIKTNGDIRKLPKWAQSYIERLFSRIEELQSLMSPPSDSPLSWQSRMLDPVCIPKGSRLTIRLSRGDVDFHLQEDDDQIKVYGDIAIEIHPVAANSLILRLED